MLTALVFALVSSAQGLEVFLADSDGKRLPGSAPVRLEQRTERTRFGEKVSCSLVGLADVTSTVRLVARLAAPDGSVKVFDGKDERTLDVCGTRRQLYLGATLPLVAAWNESRGIALAVGADDAVSFADFELSKGKGGSTLAISVRAALLRKGGMFDCAFQTFGFLPRYGIGDALARYYALYPQRFRRNPSVNQGIYGICAQYASWAAANPERCRLASATWEWCWACGRSWGDPLGQETPSGKPYTDWCYNERNTYYGRDGRDRLCVNSTSTREAYATMRDERLGYGYYCGVANGFYMMAIANISKRIAERYPDSLPVGPTVSPNDYPQAPEVFAFRECSWGKQLRAQLRDISQTCDIASIAFDVSRPAGVYRGACVRGMDNVAWDEHGIGICRGIADIDLFAYIHSLKCLKCPGNIGVAVNTDGHLTDVFYADTVMVESTPWDQNPPWPMNYRYALGEKSLTLWEGYNPKDFSPNFRKWGKADRDGLVRELSHFAVHRSLACAAALSADYLTEYVGYAMRVFSRMNDEGWKPVPGCRARGTDWEVTRYGLGEHAYLAVANLSNAVRRVILDVYPEEIRSGFADGGKSSKGVLFAPYFGGEAVHRFSSAGEELTTETGAMLFTALEAVGESRGNGTLAVSWEGDADTLRLKVRSGSFDGEVKVRKTFGPYVLDGEPSCRISAGECKSFAFHDGQLPGVAEKIRKLDLREEGGRALFEVRYADDKESRDMAERIAFFFKAKERSALQERGASADEIWRSDCRPRLTVEPSLGRYAVSIGGIVLRSKSRQGLSDLVRRFLDVLNDVRYPDYVPANRMTADERRYFPLTRR